MTMIYDDSATTRAEIEYAEITQVSAIGSLADSVIRELSRLQTGDMSGEQLVGIPLAASAFRSAIEEIDRPRNFWETPTSAADVLHFAVPPFASRGAFVAEDSTDLKPWLNAIAEMLESVAAGSPSAEQVALLREQFSDIALQTMRVARGRDTARFDAF